jgi:plasmid stabilization system protein ParE
VFRAVFAGTGSVTEAAFAAFEAGGGSRRADLPARGNPARGERLQADFHDSCLRLGVDPRVVRSDNRGARATADRRRVIFALRALGYSTTEIGRAVIRHYTTVIWALKPENKTRKAPKKL